MTDHTSQIRQPGQTGKTSQTGSLGQLIKRSDQMDWSNGVGKSGGSDTDQMGLTSWTNQMGQASQTLVKEVSAQTGLIVWTG